MEETPVRAGADLIDDVGFKVDVEGAGHVLSGRGLREERAETIIVSRRRALDEAAVGLQTGVSPNFGGRRVETHAQTMLGSVELPYRSIQQNWVS